MPPAPHGQDSSPTSGQGCQWVDLAMSAPLGPVGGWPLGLHVRGVGTPRLPSPRPASRPTLLPWRWARGNPVRTPGRPPSLRDGRGEGGSVPFPTPRPADAPGSRGQLTVQVADLAVLDCWKVTSKWWGPG